MDCILMNITDNVKPCLSGVALVSVRQHENSVFIGEIEIDSSPGRARRSVTIGDYSVFKVTEPKYFHDHRHAQSSKLTTYHTHHVALMSPGNLSL
jgi:hypothetical protein